MFDGLFKKSPIKVFSFSVYRIAVSAHRKIVRKCGEVVQWCHLPYSTPTITPNTKGWVRRQGVVQVC